MIDVSDPTRWREAIPGAADRLDHLPPPARVFAPTSLEALDEALREAADADQALWPMGAGHHVRPPGGLGLGVDWALLSTRRLDRLVEVDRRSGVAVVEAGMTLAGLEAALVERELTLGHLGPLPPAATVGGLLSRRWPVTPTFSLPELGAFSCVGLEAQREAGSRFHYTPAPRKASGPDLRACFMGAAGAGGVITRAWIGAAPRPEKQLMVLARGQGPALLEALLEALRRGVRPWTRTLLIGPQAELRCLLAGDAALVDGWRAQLAACLPQGVALELAETAAEAAPISDPRLRAAALDPWSADLGAAQAALTAHGDLACLRAAIPAALADGMSALIAQLTPFGGWFIAQPAVGAPRDDPQAQALARLPWRWRRGPACVALAAPSDAAWLRRWRAPGADGLRRRWLPARLR